MDLAFLDTTTKAEAGVELEIKHPKTGKGIGFFLTIKGSDSKTYAKALKEIMKKVGPDTTEEEIREKLIVACTVGWRGEEVVDGKPQACPVMLDGKEIKFSESALAEMIKRMPTIRDQANAFMTGRANFLPEASGS